MIMDENKEKDDQDVISQDDKKLLRKFNWGAFILAPIWSLVYRQWGWFAIYVMVYYFFKDLVIIKLSLISIFAAIMAFEANKLVWKKFGYKFSNILAMIESQNKWIKPAIIVAILQIILGLWYGFAHPESLTNLIR